MSDLLLLAAYAWAWFWTAFLISKQYCDSDAEFKKFIGPWVLGALWPATLPLAIAFHTGSIPYPSPGRLVPKHGSGPDDQ